jgi:hypothetical protein
MPRPAKVWWNKQKQAWFTEVGGKRRMLAKGKANKTFAKDRLQALLDEQGLRLICSAMYRHYAVASE